MCVIQYATKPKKVLGSSGQLGNSNDQFNNPYGIVFDYNNQRMIISDERNHRLKSYDLNGQFLHSFGSQGNSNTQFNYPSQLSIHPITNQFIVADCSNNRIQMFDEKYQFVQTIGSQLLKLPCATSFSQQPPYNIVAANGNCQIHIFTPTNNNNGGYNCIRSFCSNGNGEQQVNGVFGILFDNYINNNRNRISVCDCYHHRLSIWDTNGSNFIKTVKLDDMPNSLCIDPTDESGNRYIVNCISSIQVMDGRNDKCIYSIGSSKGKAEGQFDLGYGVAVDATNAVLWACDHNNHRVQLFN